MRDEALLRYSRHILLDEIGIEGQTRISNAHVLIVGAGGLGAPAAMYLAAAGVGQITLVDPDEVDLTNLQRQIIHTTARIGQAKVASAAHTLHALNPTIRVHTANCRADASWLDVHLSGIDVVLDCSDNFATRHTINRACVLQAIPLVSGAVVRFDGQIAVYSPHLHASPCYACTFPETDAPPPSPCATMGVFAPLVGVIGAIQAAETLKLLLGVGESLHGRILLLDGLRMTWSEIRIPRNPLCPVCANTSVHQTRQ